MYELSKPLVSADFRVPERLECEGFCLRKLAVSDLLQDFAAVSESRDALLDLWPGSGWPDGLTLEQDLLDLAWHQKEFELRRSFAYGVHALEETRMLGCLYIYPSVRADYDAAVYLWVRQSEQASGLDARLFARVQQWLHDDWGLRQPAFPGRSLSWDAWYASP